MKNKNSRLEGEIYYVKQYHLRKILLVFIGLPTLFIAWCGNEQNIDQLKVQNTILQQEINQQKLEATPPVNNYKSSSNQANESTTYPVQEKKVTPLVPQSQYNNTRTETIETDYSTKTSCCKVCSKGKACWDSCISRSYTCHKWPGCACDW